MPHKINLFSNFPLSSKIKNQIKKSINYILNQFNLKLDGELDVILVRSSFIRRLNRDFLGRDTSTTNLSFDLGGKKEIYVKFMPNDINLTVFYIIHGILHLLGYDHIFEDKKMQMEKLEKEIWEILKEWKF